MKRKAEKAKEEELTGKTKRFMKKVDKFKDFEERLNNQHIIENMIKVGFSVTKGEKQEVLVPKNGEFLVLKSKVYQDPSIALRIPIHDLLDGTKTSEELKKKFSGIISNLMQQEGLAEATDRETVFEYLARQEANSGFADAKYDFKLTTDLKEITAVQQKKFLTPSSVLFNDVRELVSPNKVVNGDQTLCSRPLSAKVVMERASKLRITSGKTLDPRSTEIKDSVTEVQALESISRNKVDVKKIKTNSYQIKNKNTVYGISGYRAQKLVDPEQAAEELRAQEKSRNSKFSPFLMYPMDAKPPETALYDSSSNSSNGLFSLEYFIFPENLDRDPVEATYNRLRETMPDSRIYGFTRYFDNKGGFTWRRCEVLRYNPTDEKLTVKWIDKFVTKDVTRANFYFEAENEKEYFKMLENAKKWREYSCTFMRYLDIVDKMDTPSNSLQDKIKDRIIFLVMDNCFRVKPPREPTAREKISLQERFKSSLFLNNRPELNLPPGYSIVDHFRDKKYDLKYLNRLTEEIEREFVRANHQIEFNNSLPYNEERQKMFRGFLDEELFIPRFILNQRQLGHDGLVVKLSPDKRELHDFLALYSTVKDNVHQANLERSRLIHSANLSLFEIRGYLFALTEFEKAYDIKDFLGREEDKSREFFRSTGNHVGDINHELLKIVNRENEELKKRNEDRERKIQTLAERLAKMENELPAQVVRVISRFQTMLNFKFEYTIKEALRNSLFAYNRSFANVLGRFERILNKREGDVDYENLSYNMLLDYQNHMQYQEHQTDCPLISLRLSVGAKIQVDEAFQTLQQALKDFFDENVKMGDLIPCLYARDVGFVRATKCLRILETEREFIAARRAENTRIIDSVFAIFNCFFAKVKEFEFIFDFKSEKVSQMMSKMNFDKLKRQILKIKKARDEKETVFFKDRLQTGLFVVDCSDLKRKLDLQIATVIETLINQLKEMISADNDKLAQEIDDIGASLSRQVNNLDELEVLRTEAQQIELVLENIRKKIDVIMKKMEMADELYYQMPYEDFKTSWKSMEFPNKIRERAQRTLMRLDKREKELGDLLKADQLDLDLDMGKIALEFDRLNKIDDLEKTDYASKEFVELKVRLDNAIEKSQKIQNGERIMNLPKLTDYSNLHEFKKTFSPFNQFWEYASNYQYRFLTSLENQLADIDRTLFTVEITETWNDLFKMEKNEFKTNTQMLNLCKQLRAKYNTLKPYIPLVNDLKNDNLKNRHWKDIMNILKIEGEVSEVQKITLRTILDKGAMEYRDEIKDISEIASKESGFVRLLSSLRQDWKNINFEISEFRNTGRFILKNVDPITDKLDEDIAKLSSILSSPYVKFLENDIVLERTILIQNQETIEIWIKVQKHWQYLQPIFSSEDIIKQRPNEALKFQNIEKLFHSIIDSSRNNPAVPECCKIQKIFENLTYCFQLAEEIIKSLNDYLNTKRVAFPRFYFLPNEELLTILAQTKDVRMIQKFLNKCFEGLEVLTFSEDNIITHMNSIHGEALLLSDQINPFEEPGVPRNVEEWLSEVEVAMKTTLHDYFKKSLESFKDMSKSTWLLSWPGQIVTAISQTLWTSEVESSLLLMKENQGALAEAYKFQKAKLMEIVKVMQEGSLSKRDTQTFEVLIVMEVHGLDVIEDLEKNKVQGKDLFEWTSQLRYYWEYHEKEKKHRLNLRMIITERQYGWEYLGNQGRLVITPLTDRCYRTLMSALHMNLGGAPEGPAGTGKTETTKDLAKALAKHCVVFNCSTDLEIEQMAKFFMGLTSCGSWACFDEFNRIQLDVLSVIAQQILQIQTAILADSEAKIPSKQFTFNGTIVKLDPTCAVFITMNPGYAGRSELPDNLKRLFRSICMMVPFFAMIAEVSLYSYGYKEAKMLSIKIVQSLKLSSEQLSTQSHYDFGMRSVKAILVAAGNLKKQHKTANESSLVIQAICDCTFPKFTSEDIPLFNNILKDLFPNDEKLRLEDEHMELGIRMAAKHFNLIFENAFREKTIQLYETVLVRHGLMLVGEPFSGKSSIMKVLKLGWEIASRLPAKRSQLKEQALKLALLERESKLGILASISIMNQKNHEHKSEKTPESELDRDPELNNVYQRIFQELLGNLTAGALHKEISGLNIQIDKINPKSISPHLLYGTMDETSGDWREGIAAKIFKDAYQDESGNKRWITFDGPVDANWIEDMNTVLDDSKKLCLPNSEQIKLTERTSVLFEVEDLAEASLATVSRCGMVFMEAKQLDKKSIFENWYLGLPSVFQTKEQKAFLDALYENVIAIGFQVLKEENIKKVSSFKEQHLLVNVLKYFQGMLFKNRSKEEILDEMEKEREKAKKLEEEARLMGTELGDDKKRFEFGKSEKSELLAAFIFSVIWGLGSIVHSSSRSYFSSLFGSELKTAFLTVFKGLTDSAYPPDPNKENLFDVFYSSENKCWMQYVTQLGNLKIPPEAKFTEIFIPTKDSVRNAHLLKIMIKQEMPFLFYGKTGTGKTQVIKKLILEELNQHVYIPLITVLSANTKREQLQDVFESKLEKNRRAKGVYGPVHGTKVIVFVDDLNMPNKETYGAQPPLELIRQWLDERGWYDRKTLDFKTIVDIMFVAGMGLGRPNIPNRLNRHFTTLNLFEYDDQTLKYVFKCLLDHGLHSYSERVKVYSEKWMNISVKVYNSVCKEFKPLPGKSHYLFNLRDLSKMIQGILSPPDLEYSGENVNMKQKVAKIVCYEAKRVFSDRFVDKHDKEKLNSILRQVIQEFMGEPLDKLVPPTEFYVFGNFVDLHSNQKLYREINDLAAYRKTVMQYLDEYNEINKVKISILLFEEFMDNLAKMNRILSREYGHALQIGLGGDGRRTITKLATYMQDFELQEMDSQKDVPPNDWADFLREVFRKSGIKDVKTTVLVTDAQLSQDLFFEDINNLLNIGEVPNLFKADDKEGIIVDIKTIAAKSGKRSLNNMAAWEEFVHKCKINLHLVFCVSPIGDSLRLRLRNFPSLVNCSAIIWNLPWSNDSLKVIGNESLERNAEGKELIQGRESDLVNIFVSIHQIVEEETRNYEKELKKYYYVTPLNYNFLLENFNKLLAKKQEFLIQERNRYEQGVKKLDECAKFVEETKILLEGMGPQLKEKSKETEIAIKKVEAESAEAEITRGKVAKDREMAEEKREVALSIKRVCDEKLAHAKPVLEEAQEQVQKMDRNSFVEIKAYKDPPIKAVIVFEGVLRLMGCIPKKTQERIPYFKEMMKKKLNNVDGFLLSLKNFKIEDVSENVMNSLKEFIKTEANFNINVAQGVSLACYNLCKWVFALNTYYDTYQSILPLVADLKKAEESEREASANLEEKMAQLKKIEDRVQALKDELDFTMNEKNELYKKIRDCEIKLNRSLELNQRLGGERGRWENQVVTLDYEIKNVLGDIILACGSISYLGAFTMEFRKKILFGRWVPELNNLCIPNSGEKFTLQNILSNPMEIQEWNLCGLPFDSTSVDNVIIMNYQKENIPLVLDPQSQFLKFIKNYEKSKAAEQRRSVVCEKVSVKKLEEKLSNSIRMGDTVILESVGPNISYLFDDLISKKYTLTAGMRCVQVGTQVVEIDRSFKLFLVSNLNNPHYTPDILAKVVFLDFSITPAGLQQQLLSLICKKEEPKDEDEKIIIMKESMDCGIKQKDIELKILKLLNDSKGNVVENDALINSLTESKSTSEDIQLRLKQSAKTEEKIERNRHNYKPLAQLASNIFLIIKELYKWDPMYQFSLKWFESVLLKSITITDKPLVKNPERRVQDLKNSLLYQSYRNICRSVFVKHKQLFSVLLAVTQLKTEDKLDPLVWQLFLTEKGPMDLEKESEEAPEGMNGLRWKKLIELSKVPRFSGLRDYSVKQTAELNSFIDRMEDTQLFEEAVWAKEINSEFDLFSSLTFIKVFRPDLFPKYSQELIRTLLSDKFNEDVVVPLESTFDESSGTKPYIFILAPGDDPQDEIRKYASELGVRVIPISLGRGQGERAKQAIYESCEGNTWILLQNCHLAVAWLPELEGIIEAIGSDAYLKKLHPNFRLFLTAFSTNLFPIGILQDGIKLTKDPPKGIKANMTQIYMAQASSKQEKKFYNEMVETRLDDWRPLFMALCYFHALIRERRRFGPVGWNIPYDFNESDFKISVKQLKYVLNDNSSNSIPFKALIYLTSECYYGGKVTENMDRRLLTTLLAGFYNESAIKDEYFFSEQRTHYIPKIQLTLESALEFLENLPENNHPGLYGLNQNASISSAINETQQMVDNILVINPVSSGSAASQNSNDQVKQLVALLLKKLPSNYDTEEVRTLRPLGYGQCMNTVLIQEVLRYNTLLTEIRSTLTDLKNANEGTIVMTLPLEDMVDKMLKNQIPAQWRKKSYPSLKPMMSYFEDLLQRILMFQTWINTGKPKVYWVSGFFFTQSFFTGVLQDFARKHTVSIDRLSFSHSILQESEAELNAKDEGCYIKGLYLEAARWDAATLSLQESRPKEIFFNMPIIHFQPYEVNAQEAQAVPEEEELPGKHREAYYECPTYRTTERRGVLFTTGHSSNYILSIQLRSQVDVEHWVKRGVALISQLND